MLSWFLVCLFIHGVFECYLLLCEVIYAVQVAVHSVYVSFFLVVLVRVWDLVPLSLCQGQLDFRALFLGILQGSAIKGLLGATAAGA